MHNLLLFNKIALILYSSYRAIIVVILLVISQCSLYNLATEEDGFNENDRPNINEGIAVFIFRSANKAPLPSEVFFRLRKQNDKNYHFVLSAFIPRKEVSRYIFLRKGIYSFAKMVYKFNGHTEDFYFPSNTFHISSSHINYIGDIIFEYNRGKVSVRLRDNMNKSMYDFYKRYKQITLMYPKRKSLLMLFSLDKQLKNLYKR